MTSPAIRSRDEQIDSLRTRLSGLRGRVERESKGLQRMATEVVSGYVFGMLESQASAQGHTLATVGGLNPKLTWAAAAYAGGAVAGGTMGEVAQDVARALFTIYGYEQGRASPGR